MHFFLNSWSVILQQIHGTPARPAAHPPPTRSSRTRWRPPHAGGRGLRPFLAVRLRKIIAWIRSATQWLLWRTVRNPYNILVLNRQIGRDTDVFISLHSFSHFKACHTLPFLSKKNSTDGLFN